MFLNNYPIICLMGPTAVGKTDLALALAKTLPCELISVDSAMVYRGMNIGTAKPSPAILKETPHHLIDICDPCQPYSVGNFLKDAESIIATSIAKQRIPLFVGGTMLYFYALYKGLAKLPNRQQNERLFQELGKLSTPALYQKLKTYDLKSAEHIHENDRQRIERALFVYESTGKPLSALQNVSQPKVSNQIIWITLYPADRNVLRKKIALRFQNMLTQGLVEEVVQLRQHADFSPELPAYRAVGYRQVLEYFEDKINYQTMEEKSITATCQLAKRQLTWLKKWPDTSYFLSNAVNLQSDIQKYIAQQLRNLPRN